MANGLHFAIGSAYEDVLKHIKNKDIDKIEEHFKTFANLVDSRNRFNSQELAMTKDIKDFWENKSNNQNQ
tara:strand:- start:67 stop:276 length:210 start_codon:yes stop_codon:yes gene_type:complete